MPPGSFDIDGIIWSFPRYTGPGTADYVIDFLGTRTRTAYIHGLKGGLVEDYPTPVNFHATALEWAGALAAVNDAVDELIAVELGAGWAPWLVSVAAAARLRGIERVRLVGVEGSKQHCQFMATHFADNGLDPSQHTLLHGVVGPSDGVAEFPVLAEPNVDWGTPAVLSSAVTGDARLRLRGRLAAAVRPLLRYLRHQQSVPELTERVRCYSVDTLLQPFREVDLVHVDIQGHEYLVVAAARQTLLQKVKRLVIGTHSRAIEQQLLEEMTAHGWVLEAEESCQFRQQHGNVALVRDGCQVWRNPLLSTSAVSPISHRAA